MLSRSPSWPAFFSVAQLGNDRACKVRVQGLQTFALQQLYQAQNGVDRCVLFGLTLGTSWHASHHLGSGPVAGIAAITGVRPPSHARLLLS